LIHAFLDDGYRDPFAVCAGLVVDASQQPDAEACLADAKARSRIDPTARVHCREIFHGQARARGPWAALDDAQVRLFVSMLVRDIKPLTLQPQIWALRPQDVNVPKGEEGSSAFELDLVGTASMAYNFAIGVLDRKHAAGGFRFWVDEDVSLTKWGQSRRQATRTRWLYCDRGPGAAPMRREPEPMGEHRPPLLELADVYAYARLQTLHAPPGQFRDWCAMLLNLARVEMGWLDRPASNSPEWVNPKSLNLPPPDDQNQIRPIILPGRPEDHADRLRSAHAASESTAASPEPEDGRTA
jgi:hypothetical protein